MAIADFVFYLMGTVGGSISIIVYCISSTKISISPQKIFWLHACLWQSRCLDSGVYKCEGASHQRLKPLTGECFYNIWVNSPLPLFVGPVEKVSQHRFSSPIKIRYAATLAWAPFLLGPHRSHIDCLLGMCAFLFVDYSYCDLHYIDRPHL